MDDTSTAARGGRRRLGRGLTSLIAVPVEVPVEAPAAGPASEGDAAASDQNVDRHVPSRPGTSTATPATQRSGDAAVVDPVSRSGGVTVASTQGQVEAGGDIPPDGEIRHLPVSSIRANPRQPREHFDDMALESLASSIRSAGLMQPIVVRSRADQPGRFELIAGERRLRAAERIGMKTIPAVVREVDDRTAAEWALIENLQRQDLNPIERAHAFRRLIDEFGLSHQELAEQVGVDRSSVSNLLRLNDLDQSTAAMVADGLLSMGHAKALLACTDVARRAELAAMAVRQGWTVRQTEARARHAERPTEPSAPRRGSAHLQDLERRLGEHLGTRVRIVPGRKRGTGRLSLDYFSLEQFEGLLLRMGFEGSDGRP